MSANPFSLPYACARCRDFRIVARHVSARREDLLKCPECGPMSAEEYENFRRASWAAAQPRVMLSELDLSPKEFSEYKKLRAEHPETARATALAWMEGRRFDPEKDGLAAAP